LAHWCTTTDIISEKYCTYYVVVTISGFIRYISIVHPTSKMAVFTWPCCFAGLGIIWLYASIWTSFPFIPGFSIIRYNPGMHICLAENEAISTYGTFIFVYTASVVVLGYSYVRIFMAVRQSGRRIGLQAVAKTGSTAEQRHADRRRARRMAHEEKLAAQLIIIFAVFVLCWAPFISYTMFELEACTELHNAL